MLLKYITSATSCLKVPFMLLCFESISSNKLSVILNILLFYLPYVVFPHSLFKTDDWMSEIRCCCLEETEKQIRKNKH